MLVKFDTKSVRVKGLAFHPKRPWILASLHSGEIQLWDYQMGVQLDKFLEHEGPVRGVDFNLTQPLFVSGGDDARIKVWNHKQRRCLFTLLGHLDYIRTVKFHHEYPWILSASDDQTIRIWNWQARSCVSVMTGHNHYVMSAMFHPQNDLVVSASLDTTVRVWDTTGLRRKNVRSGPPTAGQGRDTELFGGMDAVVKYVLEGHDRGVNWATFHPSQSLIASGADDRSVKLWRMSDTRAWEVDSMRGHSNNVSSVVFHPVHDLIVTNSEDRSIRIWDMNKRVLLHTYRREEDRFWTMVAHPTQNLLAAGHDSGLSVFKLERERPPYDVLSDGSVYFVKDRYIRRGNSSGTETFPIVASRRYGGMYNWAVRPRTLTVNPFSSGGDVSMLVTTKAESGAWDLYVTKTDAGPNAVAPEPVHGAGLSAAFVGRNKFATLDRATRQIVVRDFNGNSSKSVQAPHARTDRLFQASTQGRVLAKTSDRLCLFELASRRQLNEVTGLSVKYVTWSPDGQFVALQSKHTIVLADKMLNKLCSVTEGVRIKGGAWDDNGVFVYTTVQHVKYIIASTRGDTGIVRSLSVPVYPVSVQNGKLQALSRNGLLVFLRLNSTEYKFKLALARNDYASVLSVIRSGELAGAAVISYLKHAGFPEVALHFAKDQRMRLALALECGKLGVAEEAAKALNDPAAWRELGEAALLHGDVDLAGSIFKRTGQHTRLAFLRLINGDLAAVKAMAADTPADDRDAVMGRFSAALVTGNISARVAVLESAGQIALAYTCAKLHGLDEDAARLAGYMQEASLPLPDLQSSVSQAPRLLVPPPVIQQGGCWPRLPLKQSVFDAAVTNADSAQAAGAAIAAAGSSAAVAAALHQRVDPDKWDDDLESGGPGSALQAAAAAAAAASGANSPTGDGSAEWGDDDLDLGLDEMELPEAAQPEAVAAEVVESSDPLQGMFVAPMVGQTFSRQWLQASTLAGDHAAAGDFASAAKLLNRQIGVVNFEPMVAAMRTMCRATHAVAPTLPGLAPVLVPIMRDAGKPQLPLNVYTLRSCVEQLAGIYRAFQSGKFSEVARLCDALFVTLPLLTVRSAAEETQAKEMLAAATQYKLAVTLELSRKGTAADTAEGVKRQLELAAYMTHCQLQDAHKMLALNLAMSIAFKNKNFIHASVFARRLLELPPVLAAGNEKLAAKSRKVLAVSEQQARNAVVLDYDGSKAFDICAGSLTPLYAGQPSVRSPYSGAYYQPSYTGSVCRVDGLSSVGVETIGLVIKLA